MKGKYLLQTLVLLGAVLRLYREDVTNLHIGLHENIIFIVYFSIIIIIYFY